MVDLTIYLNGEYHSRVDKEALAKKVGAAIGKVFKYVGSVKVSEVHTNKPAELIFNDMSPVDMDDIEAIVDGAVDAMIFSINSLDGKKIGVTIHPTIIYEIEGEVL